MTNEDRLATVERLASAARKKAENESIRISPVGRPCSRCRYWDGWEDGMAECDNPAVRLQGRWIKSDHLRGESGVCGPDGLFWEPAFRERIRNLFGARTASMESGS